MMKSLILAMALVSTPVLAADVSDVANVGGADDIRFGVGFGPQGPSFGIGFGPGHHGPGPGWGRPPRMITCVAQNARGMTFQGYGRFPQEAQNNAMGQCYQYSRFCQISWCR